MPKIKVEFLINPFCLCERDLSCLSQICEKHGVTFDAYNLISFYPFRKFGFVLDEATIGWEFRPETRMCFCDL